MRVWMVVCVALLSFIGGAVVLASTSHDDSSRELVMPHTPVLPTPTPTPDEWWHQYTSGSTTPLPAPVSQNQSAAPNVAPTVRMPVTCMTNSYGAVASTTCY